ncbi:MAG: hypothetical protein PHU25_22185, partial [Deltaproteobacteria bacterium]|nr:hypothetical protein [Deltaproteobacteria bacterium]
CLPLKPLLALAKPESRKDTGLVSIDVADLTATILVDGVTSKLPALPAEDFPEVMSADGLSLVALWPAKDLHDALAYVLPAANDDVTRPHLCGVNLSDNRAKATDGHRLHIATLPTAIPEGMFLSTDAANTLVHILSGDGQVVLARTESTLRARCGAWTLDAKLKTETFPDVDQAVPSVKTMATRLTVEPQAVRRAMSRIGKITRRGCFKMVVNGVVTLSADSDEGSTEFVLPTVSNTHVGTDLITGFNAVYLAEAVNGSSETAEIHLGGVLDPMRIDFEGKTAVVMPVRI